MGTISAESKRLKELVMLFEMMEDPDCPARQMVNWHALADAIREAAADVASVCEMRAS